MKSKIKSFIMAIATISLVASTTVFASDRSEDIAMLQNESNILRASEATIKVFDEDLGLYEFDRTRVRRVSDGTDEKLLNVGENFYLQIEDDIYAKADVIEFYADDISEDIQSEYIKEETLEIVNSVLDAANSGEFTLVDNKVSVYIPENEMRIASANSLSRAASWPVVNEQIRYTSYTNEKVIKSGSNALGDYGNTLLNNAAKAALEGSLSKLIPYAGTITTIANLFPSYYNEVRVYTNWTLGVKLYEEKVVQLSWVYIDNSPYLGAQTQFTTKRHLSIAASGGQFKTDQSGFEYYRTPHYQNPAEFARQGINDTRIERIDSYEILGHSFSSPN